MTEREAGPCLRLAGPLGARLLARLVCQEGPAARSHSTDRTLAGKDAKNHR